MISQHLHSLVPPVTVIARTPSTAIHTHVVNTNFEQARMRTILLTPVVSRPSAVFRKVVSYRVTTAMIFRRGCSGVHVLQDLDISEIHSLIHNTRSRRFLALGSQSSATSEMPGNVMHGTLLASSIFGLQPSSDAPSGLLVFSVAFGLPLALWAYKVCH